MLLLYPFIINQRLCVCAFLNMGICGIVKQLGADREEKKKPEQKKNSYIYHLRVNIACNFRMYIPSGVCSWICIDTHETQGISL